MKDDQAARGRDSLSAAIARISDGQHAALEEVYAETSAKLFGICLRILQDRGEAEEAMQDIYLNVWRRASTFDPDRGSPMAWLVMLARTRSIDRLRAARRQPANVPIEGAVQVADDRIDALAMLEGKEKRTQLMLCIEELEVRQAAAIRAAFFDGQTYAEQAVQADVPLGTMKSWVRRGLIRLRECLER